jgi:delta 1-pyrroline-5-carboxylate dehydrogenase
VQEDSTVAVFTSEPVAVAANTGELEAMMAVARTALIARVVLEIFNMAFS